MLDTALLDAVYLPLHLPTTTTFATTTYGMPRVGNIAFANYGEIYHPSCKDEILI